MKKLSHAKKLTGCLEKCAEKVEGGARTVIGGTAAIVCGAFSAIEKHEDYMTNFYPAINCLKHTAISATSMVVAYACGKSIDWAASASIDYLPAFGMMLSIIIGFGSALFAVGNIVECVR